VVEPEVGVTDAELLVELRDLSARLQGIEVAVMQRTPDRGWRAPPRTPS